MAADRKTDEIPIISIVGFSGSGKTTLLERLIPALGNRGFRIGTIKHHCHDFEIDKPGKDSWRHKQAGADVSVISSPGQIGMVRSVDHDYQPEELGHLFSGVDIILTEGYKRSDHLKIEVFRAGISGQGLLCGEDDGLLAVVSDDNPLTDVPVFGVTDAAGVAERIIGVVARKDRKLKITANPR